ncbi:siderophore-interacting protein [Brevibacterium litoralis]|uniref:siderophore-interacting protein n=1 Tax=Brevibacterium litoralis TaxID=3138935 RepID=UPI0032EEA003
MTAQTSGTTVPTAEDEARARAEELARAEKEMTERTVAAMEAFEATDPQVTTVRVVRSVQVTPGFMRLTFGPDLQSVDGGELPPFSYIGADQWFRLFVPAGGDPDAELVLPRGGSAGWYKRYTTLPEDTRAVCRNYTVREFRAVPVTEANPGGWEFDVDFVLHRNEFGELEGLAAHWSTLARPGHRAGILGQSVIYDPTEEPGTVTILTDETGLPGVEAIVRNRPAGSETTVLVTVANCDDERGLHCANACAECFFCAKNPKVHVRWLDREAGESWERALDAHLAVTQPDYFYAVGSQPMVLDARKRAKGVGLTNDRIRFCAYWR